MKDSDVKLGQTVRYPPARATGKVMLIRDNPSGRKTVVMQEEGSGRHLEVTPREVRRVNG